MVKNFAGKRLPPALEWNYDSTSLLQASKVPMLWLLAEQDSEAPTALTAASVGKLAQAGSSLEVAIVAGAEHGMLLFRNQGGQRVNTGYHPAYFRRMLEFWRLRFAAESVAP